jgi:uracil-DNA glycosylase
MRTCRLCLDAGFEISPGAVFTGRSSAEVMIIGQAPGVTEVEAGRPFNASSGRRLFQWLAEAGWEEVDFRERGDRVPGKEEQAMCRSFLEEEVRYVEPRLIIPVGGLAIRLFYPASAKLRQIIGTAAYFSPDLLARIAGPFSIGQAENFGEFVAEKPSGGRWVVPLPHPSGASAWPNQADNRALIHRATAILAQIRRQWRL